MPFRIPQFVKSFLTLAVLLGLLAFGAVWGYAQMTAPFPERTPPPLCEVNTIGAGDKVLREEITVSVYNAGDRGGLARRTLQLFVDEGYGEGNDGNAPDDVEVAVAEIWSNDPDNPGVRLVRRQLPKGTKVVEPPVELAPGVVVIVGDGFDGLRKGPAKMKAKTDTTICSPPPQLITP